MCHGRGGRGCEVGRVVSAPRFDHEDVGGRQSREYGQHNGCDRLVAESLRGCHQQEAGPHRGCEGEWQCVEEKTPAYESLLQGVDVGHTVPSREVAGESKDWRRTPQPDCHADCVDDRYLQAAPPALT